MVFRRGLGLRPIDSVKHVVDSSGIIALVTNTVLQPSIDGVDTYSLSDVNGVPTGAKVFSIFYSMYFIAEGGELATEVPLVDWYIIHNPGDTFADTFDANNLPTPGATGSHKNKRHIIHEEKGLTGGGEVSLAGLPMIFKGVIRIPRGRQRIGQNDTIQVCGRTNFNTKFCIKAIYKHYK